MSAGRQPQRPGAGGACGLAASLLWRPAASHLLCRFIPLQMVLPKAQIEDNADATIVRAQMHLQETQVVDVDRICKQASVDKVAALGRR